MDAEVLKDSTPGVVLRGKRPMGKAMARRLAAALLMPDKAFL